MIALSTPIPQPLPDAGGRQQDVSPPASVRPPSPKLGNFSSIFDDWPGGFSSTIDQPTSSSSVISGDPVKSLLTSDAVVTSVSAGSTANVPRGSAFNMGFLSGLDFSTIESPRGTPGSLLLDTISEDGSGEDDEDKAGDEENRGAGILLSGPNGLFSAAMDDVVIASPSTSPPTSVAAVTAKAVAAVAAATTPARPISILKSPKRTPGPFGTPTGKTGFNQALTQYDLPYPLPSSMLLSSPLGASPILPNFNHPIQPLSWHSKEEKLKTLELKLKPEYKRDRSLRFPGASEEASNIHVFVDLSNIVIGFYNRIKIDRGFPQEKKMTAPPFFFDAFARILERNRPAARLITAGSVPEYNNKAKWPSYMRQAEELGYEMNILGRVAKPAIPSPKLKPTNKYYNNNFNNNGNYGHKKSTSRGKNNYDGHNSSFADIYSSDDGYSSPPPLPSSTKIGEQAVDEILHLKMCHSVLDHDAGTIVLATGDAAEAEFSDGFLKHVERALGRGWCVELLSWKMGISNAWRELERKQKGTGRFRIIELDKYAEDLLDMTID
ncbi:hypothetical protein Sste5346_001340 [Sporothrix stenoceras]|uniref:NYN domain-containing protein n=1 Tax=Sporothrix stenoceras TaxID=5173 RepID=A0ABR3ZNT7_9PEZI